MKIPFHEAIARLDRVREVSGLIAFCSLIGGRIAEGNRLDAYRMLTAVGATPAQAHEMVEGWPTETCRKLPPSVTRRWARNLTVVQEAALRMSYYDPEFELRNWPVLMLRAATEAKRRRALDSDPQQPRPDFRQERLGWLAPAPKRPSA